MHGCLTFLLSIVAISLSGVMAPGPMTAATLAAGTKNRHAGVLIALGHGMVEFPLMFLIITGLGRWFELAGVKIAIGFIGGLFLIYLGSQMLKDSRKPQAELVSNNQRGAFLTGIVMTGGNPYFLLWWATAGLLLANKAFEFGFVIFVAFAILHWLCDLGWLEALSLASFKGSKLLSGKSQQWVLGICGLALIFFAVKFLGDAARLWMRISH